jgi:hypothetical protein
MEETHVIESYYSMVSPLTEQWFEEAHVSSEAKAHLLKSLDNLVSGRDPVPTFKLYGRDDSLNIIQEFLDNLNWDKYDVPSEWREYEYDRLQKVGRQGGFHKWDDEIRELMALYVLRPKEVQSALIPLDVTKEFMDNYSHLVLRQMRDTEVIPYLISSGRITDRAAGCRDFNLKKTDKIAKKHALEDFKSGLYKIFRMYTFMRFYKLKDRIFFPGPYASLIAQGKYVIPFIEAIQDDIRRYEDKSKLVQHADKLGFDPCFEIMGKEIRRKLPKLAEEWHCNEADITLAYIQGDFEKMDTTEGESQYNDSVIPVFTKCFNVSGNTRTKLCDDMLQTCTMNIITPDGVITAKHGTGSGMENTNIGEGLSNDKYQIHVLYNLSSLIVKRHRQYKAQCVSRRVNGDDSGYVVALYHPKGIIDIVWKQFVNDMQDAAEDAAAIYGFRINEKWRMSTQMGLFCQNGYWYNRKTQCIEWMYPSTLILNSILHPQKEYSKKNWDPDFVDLTNIEKLDNGRHLPYFHELVDYVNNGMRYGLMRRNGKIAQRILSKYDRYRALQSEDYYINRRDYQITKSPTLQYLFPKYFH